MIGWPYLATKKLNRSDDVDTHHCRGEIGNALFRVYQTRLCRCPALTPPPLDDESSHSNMASDGHSRRVAYLWLRLSLHAKVGMLPAHQPIFGCGCGHTSKHHAFECP